MNGYESDARRRRAADQCRWLLVDTARMTSGVPWTWFVCWFRAPFWGAASYRVERALYLWLGPAWRPLRILLTPVLALITPSNIDIHYGANIGPGLEITHPALGVVVSRHAVIGRNATFTGGNCVGIRRVLGASEVLHIGNDVNLGANAVVLGPVIIGDGVRVGAGAVVTRDVEDGAKVAGIPATPV